MARSEMRRWGAADYDEIRGMFPDEPHIERDSYDAAVHFGCEITDRMPAGDGYWALEPRCVVRPWFRRKGRETWVCLTCCGNFDTEIRDEFYERIRQGHR